MQLYDLYKEQHDCNCTVFCHSKSCKYSSTYDKNTTNKYTQTVRVNDTEYMSAV